MDSPDALVIGAGPAGLMAADVLASARQKVLVVDAMPSLGRKFLMAGKSGLNLTRQEEPTEFLKRYSDCDAALKDAVSRFGQADIQEWANNLGEATFVGSTGRVFPKAMKASSLLRKWLAHLNEHDVSFKSRWRWAGWQNGASLFDTPIGPQSIRSRVTVLALGGGSWGRLGSDGAWAKILAGDGVEVTPFSPSNVGFQIDWSEHMAVHIGTPVKNTRLSAGDYSSRSEWVMTETGVEGGGIYDISRGAVQGAPITLDLAPDRDIDELTRRLARPRGKASLTNHIRKTLGFGRIQRALLNEWARPLPRNDRDLARTIKSLPIPTKGPHPMDRAISTGGGVAWSALDKFELLAKPGVFCAGEMLAWDAPTGGYLLTACFATGRAAARQALARLTSQ